ncbi:hypothetical protein [Aliiglaciecola litoralis]|uniref:Uncharacterized protein n=1 Tax=Aliiglaciecola litoralis TaxID=582857 RepID=A0ABP3WQW1_9ALTE
MARTEELTDIPTSDVDQVIEDYESEGAQVEKIQQPNGKWTIKATFP